MSFLDLLSPWAAIDQIEQDLANAQAALDAAIAAKAAIN